MTMGEWVPIAGLALQTILILGGGYAMVVRADMMTKALSQEVQGMKEEVKGLASIITTQAVQAERMDGLSKRLTMLHETVEDLRRGRGYVQARATVDGEY
jgi:cell division protein FtsB